MFVCRGKAYAHIKDCPIAAFACFNTREEAVAAFDKVAARRGMRICLRGAPCYRVECKTLPPVPQIPYTTANFWYYANFRPPRGVGCIVLRGLEVGMFARWQVVLYCSLRFMVLMLFRFDAIEHVVGVEGALYMATLNINAARVAFARAQAIPHLVCVIPLPDSWEAPAIPPPSPLPPPPYDA